MGQELGRISGAMLKDNLLRQGVDLAFENDLLYLKVDDTDTSTHRVGINTDSLTRELIINDSAKTTNLIIDNPIIAPGTGAITINGNTSTLTFLSENLVFPTDVIVNSTVITDGLIFDNNSIKTISSDSNLEFRPTNKLDIYSDVTFFGGVASSSVELAYKGNTIVGTIEGGFDLTFNATISSDFSPAITNSSDIGSPTLAWKTLYVNELNSDQMTFNDTSIFTKVSNSDLEFSASGAGSIAIDDLYVNDNKLLTFGTSNLEIRPASETLTVFSNTNILANLYATGDITLDGNITFGDSTADTVDFQSDFTSNILPRITDTHDFGSPEKRWAETNIESAIVGSITVDAFPIDQIPNFALRQGNIWYVAALGLDTNVGNHQQGAFATVKKALENAMEGDTVFIYPGEYEEDLPLTVPAGVSIRGSDIRQVIIKPLLSNRYTDVFLLNGDTSIEDITVKNHLYSSINDVGYAFRYAPGALLTKKSPYIRNVSVITEGSVKFSSDPRGYDQGDAGRGALVDGSVINVASFEASMLFYSTTFIVPNAVGLYMKNGVRVEWLNSFTYFASTSILAEDGVTGRLTNDGSTIRYGAEIRSIASASVYGEFGAVADGSNTLMYLINHNFAYIGVGRDSTNDKTLVIEDQQTVRLNNGRIFYSSVDHRGKFKVGDTFFVDLENGLTSIDASVVDVAGIQSVTFTTGTNTTFADSNRIETGNLRVTGNRLLSENGPINIFSVTNSINLLSSVSVGGNLSIRDNISIAGNLSFGNTNSDRIDFNSRIQSSLIPSADRQYSIGSNSANFLNLYANEWFNENLNIDTNKITATISNSNLELRSTGTGLIGINDLTVKISTLSTNTSEVILDSAVEIPISGNLQSKIVRVEDNLVIAKNTTFGVLSNNTVQFRSAINSNIIQTENSSLGLLTNPWNTLYSNLVNSTELAVYQNNIVSINSNANIELQGQQGVGVQTILVQNTGLIDLNLLDNDVVVNSNTRITENANLENNLSVYGNISVGNTNADTVTVTAKISTDLVPNIVNEYSLGSVAKLWNTIYNEQLIADNIQFNTNYIESTISNANLEFIGSGTGRVILDNLFFKNSTISSNTGNLIFQTPNGIEFKNSVNLAGNLFVSENLKFDGNLTVGDQLIDTVSFSAKFSSDIVPAIDNTYSLGEDTKIWKSINSGKISIEQIDIFNNVISVTASNADLELQSQSLGFVALADVYFKNNQISSADNQNLILKPFVGQSLVVDTSGAFILPAGVDADWIDRTAGEIRFNNTDNNFEGFKNTSNGILAGVSSDDKRTRAIAEPNIIKFFVDNQEKITITPSIITVSGLVSQEKLLIKDNKISSLEVNSDIEINPNSGFIKINDIRIGQSNIINEHNGEMVLRSAGSGYFDIRGNNGITIPSGTTAERPESPQLAQIRFNTELNDLEVYDGVSWVPASGSASEVTEEQLSELHEIYALIFG
jgi:hypothetical protein